MTHGELWPLHIAHVAIPNAHVRLSARLSAKIDVDKFHQYFLRLLDAYCPGAFDLRRIGFRVVRRAEYAAVADDLRVATAHVRDEREYVEVGEVKAQLEAAEAEHAVGFEDENESGRCRDDLRRNGLTTVASHPVEMPDTV